MLRMQYQKAMRSLRGLGLMGFMGVSCSLSGVSYGEQTPQALSSDHRIQVVSFSPNNVVAIHGRPLTTTQIIFDPDEVIKDVQNGDASAWSSSINPNQPNMMFLKPVVSDSQSNMTVVTNHHIYYFDLSAGSHDPKNMGVTYAVKFEYPEETLSAAQEAIEFHETERKTEVSAFEDPDQFNWDYSFNGDRSIVPLHVFDDGKLTYLQLRAGQAVPAVFAVDNASGKEAVVNVRVDQRYLIIQQVAPQFTLRLGTAHVASIFNNKRVAELRRNP
jgi:type IV secretion system protein VirB9